MYLVAKFTCYTQLTNIFALYLLPQVRPGCNGRGALSLAVRHSVPFLPTVSPNESNFENDATLE